MNTLYWVSYDEYFTPVSADSYADKMKYMSTNFNDAKQRYPRIYQNKVQQHSYHTSAYYSCFLTKKQTNEKQKKEQNHFWHQHEHVQKWKKNTGMFMIYVILSTVIQSFNLIT